jgi:hypothetical protein
MQGRDAQALAVSNQLLDWDVLIWPDDRWLFLVGLASFNQLVGDCFHLGEAVP